MTADAPWSADAGVIRPEPEAVEAAPVVVRVFIGPGPITQRSEPVGDCGGYTMGHDTIAAMMIAALEVGDVLVCFDCPGGAYAGGQQSIDSILEAKAKYGRRITGWVDELCASMAAWYAYTICDEVFLPIAGAIGSIGARSAHGSVAGALAIAGVAVTFACWPNEGKIAGVSELPLSDVGKARMDRGVDEAGEQFAAAIIASPYGMRHGFTRDMIVSLSADCLSGANAVTMGLADGVASFAEVQSYALAMAAGAGDTFMDTDSKAEEPEKKDPTGEPDGSDDAKPEGEEPSSACAACNSANEPNAKFCDQCGASMAAKPDDGDGDDDDAPASSKRPGAMAPKAATPPAAMSSSASLASILGATGESPLALKTAAIQLRQIADTARGVTGQIVPAAVVGALLSMPTRLDAAAQVVADRKVEKAERAKADKAAKAKADNAERLALCKRGIATGAPEMTRGKVYRDIVGEDNKRTGVTLAPMFAQMNIDTLRAHVEGLESSAPKRNPFEPDKAASEAASKDAQGSPIGADGKPTAAAIERAKGDPTVLKMFHAQGNKHSLETLAANYVTNAAANGITIGGGQ